MAINTSTTTVRDPLALTFFLALLNKVQQSVRMLFRDPIQRSLRHRPRNLTQLGPKLTVASNQNHCLRILARFKASIIQNGIQLILIEIDFISLNDAILVKSSLTQKSNIEFLRLPPKWIAYIAHPLAHLTRIQCK